jgi:hypothetical protein
MPRRGVLDCGTKPKGSPPSPRMGTGADGDTAEGSGTGEEDGERDKVTSRREGVEGMGRGTSAWLGLSMSIVGLDTRPGPADSGRDWRGEGGVSVGPVKKWEKEGRTGGSIVIWTVVVVVLGETMRCPSAPSHDDPRWSCGSARECTRRCPGDCGCGCPWYPGVLRWKGGWVFSPSSSDVGVWDAKR